MKKILALFCLFLGLLSLSTAARDTEKRKNPAVQILQAAGAAGYSVFPRSVYVGFDKDQVPVAAVVSKSFKSYTQLKMFVAVKKTGDSYSIADARVTNIAALKNKKKKKNVISALEHLTGKEVASAKMAFRKVDAVSGATRYHSAVYKQGNILAKKLVGILRNNPKASKLIPIEARGSE